MFICMSSRWTAIVCRMCWILCYVIKILDDLFLFLFFHSSSSQEWIAADFEDDVQLFNVVNERDCLSTTLQRRGLFLISTCQNFEIHSFGGCIWIMKKNWSPVKKLCFFYWILFNFVEIENLFWNQIYLFAFYFQNMNAEFSIWSFIAEIGLLETAFHVIKIFPFIICWYFNFSRISVYMINILP